MLLFPATRHFLKGNEDKPSRLDFDLKKKEKREEKGSWKRVSAGSSILLSTQSRGETLCRKQDIIIKYDGQDRNKT